MTLKHVLFVCLLLLPSSGWAMRRWPYSYTKGFDIKVVDKDTSEPISGVIADVYWREFRFQVMGPHSAAPYNEMKIMSDRSGQIAIPSKFSLNIIGPFRGINIVFHHPLYVGSYLAAYDDKYGMFYSEHLISQPEPVIIGIKSLKEKYKGVKCYAKKVGEGTGRPFSLSVEDTCRESKHYFFNDDIESEKFYRQYQQGRVKGFDQSLFPAADETQILLHKIYDDIYSKSQYKVPLDKWTTER